MCRTSSRHRRRFAAVMIEKTHAIAGCHNRASRSPSWPGRRPGKVDPKVSKVGPPSSSMAMRLVPPAKAKAVVVVNAAVVVSSRVSRPIKIRINRATRTASGRNGRIATGRDKATAAATARADRISSATHRAVIAVGIGIGRFSKERSTEHVRRYQVSANVFAEVFGSRLLLPLI